MTGNSTEFNESSPHLEKRVSHNTGRIQLKVLPSCSCLKSVLPIAVIHRHNDKMTKRTLFKKSFGMAIGHDSTIK